MYLALTTFIISLLGLVFMTWRKLVLVRREEIIANEGFIENPFLPEIKKIKHETKEKAKRYVFLTLLATLRFSVMTIRWLKEKSLELAKNLEKKLLKSEADFESTGKTEVNANLQTISEYLEKIRSMKKTIREEER